MEQGANLPAGPPLAVGRTAEVYAWDEGHVLKLFPASAALADIEREAAIGRAVTDAGISAPAVGGVMAVGDRTGILYSRITGVSMLELLMRQPWKVGGLARTLGRLHATMHQAHCPQLPSQRRGLQYAIERAPGLTPALRQAVLVRLAGLQDGDTVCHGDYHPGNVMMTAGGPVIIDWLTAGHGNPDADVARTVLLLSLGEPVNRSRVQLLLISLARRVLLNGYLRSYRALRACPQAAITAWLPVVAAARLAEGVEGETARLVALAEGAMQAH